MVKKVIGLGMPYTVLAFISVVIFVLVHLYAKKTERLDRLTHGRFLSIGGGVAISYVFIDLMPKLCKSDKIVNETLFQFFPYFQRHAYILSLTGFLLFYLVGQSHSLLRKRESEWLSLSAYALFNFLVGYAVCDKDDPEVQPLVLFTIAIALHFFTNDYTLRREYATDYDGWGKWILVASLFLGWLTGLWLVLSPAAVALVGAFIGGGVIMNIMRHELPNEKRHNSAAFLLSSIVYAIILLMIGT